MRALTRCQKRLKTRAKRDREIHELALRKVRALDVSANAYEVAYILYI